MNLERSRQRVILANRLLFWALPALALAAAADLSQWSRLSLKPILPLSPSPEHLWGLLPEVPSVELPAGIFRSPVPAKSGEARPSAAVREVAWKLKGVLMGANRRAFLEDSEGKSYWVTEGEQIGAFQVKEIRDRSVLLEKEGGGYEIRM